MNGIAVIIALLGMGFMTCPAAGSKRRRNGTKDRDRVLRGGDQPKGFCGGSEVHGAAVYAAQSEGGRRPAGLQAYLQFLREKFRRRTARSSAYSPTGTM